MSTSNHIHPQLHAITERLIERSRASRARYLQRVEQSAKETPSRDRMGCANLATPTPPQGKISFA